MARVTNARSSHVERWVVPAAREILIQEACKDVPTKFLDEVAFLEMGQSPAGEAVNEDGEGTPFIGGPSDLGIEFPNTTRFTTTPNKLCKQDDIIVCVRATIGEPRWSDGVYALGRGVAGICPKNSDIDRNFLFRIIQANERLLYEQGTGTTFKTITKDHLAKIVIPILPSKTQKAIGDFLAWLEKHIIESPDFSTAPELPDFLKSRVVIIKKIEALAARIAKAQSLREEADEEIEVLLKSCLSSIFDYEYGDELPKGWEWKSFNETLENDGMRTGPFGTLLNKSEIYAEGVPVFGIPNVGNYVFRPGFTDFVTTEKAKSLSVYVLEEGDIAVARSGTVGRSCVVPKLVQKPIMSSNLIRIRINKKVFLPDLMCQILTSSKLVERHIDKECRGSTRIFFTQKILNKFQIPVPPLDEQRRLVAYLEGMQTKVNVLRQYQSASGEELSALMPSILDRAFRGEL